MDVTSNLLESLWDYADILASIRDRGEMNSLIKFFILLCLHILWISTIEHRNLSSFFLSPGNSRLYFSRIFCLSYLMTALLSLAMGLTSSVLAKLIWSFVNLGMDAEDSSLI